MWLVALGDWGTATSRERAGGALHPGVVTRLGHYLTSNRRPDMRLDVRDVVGKRPLAFLFASTGGHFLSPEPLFPVPGSIAHNLPPSSALRGSIRVVPGVLLRFFLPYLLNIARFIIDTIFRVFQFLLKPSGFF